MNLRYKKIKPLKESIFSLTKDNAGTLLNEIAIYADQLAEDARELTYSLDNGELNSIPKRSHAELNYIEIKNRMEKILNSNIVEGLNEALYGMNQIEQFVKMANAIGLKTMGDFKDFMDREGQGKDVLTALYDYLYDEIGDLEFHAKDESLKESYLDSIKNPDYWQHQVDYQLEHFGRVGGGLIQDLDENGFYLNADNKAVKKIHEDAIKDPKIKWTFVKSKEVEDSDGFLTDYTWYEGSDGTQVMVFGDNDIYKPEDGYFDVTFTDRKQAEDWFNSY